MRLSNLYPNGWLTTRINKVVGEVGEMPLRPMSTGANATRSWPTRPPKPNPTLNVKEQNVQYCDTNEYYYYDDYYCDKDEHLNRLTPYNKLILRMPEPTKEGSVVSFRVQFVKDGTKYRYAAIRDDKGLWNTTGPKSPKGYTWHELLRWLSKMHKVTKLKVLN